MDRMKWEVPVIDRAFTVLSNPDGSYDTMTTPFFNIVMCNWMFRRLGLPRPKTRNS
jgi:hypothetical protein